MNGVRLKIIGVAVAAALALIFAVTAVTAVPPEPEKTLYEKACAALAQKVFSEDGIEGLVRAELDAGDGAGQPFRVFAFVTDGESRAKSFLGDGQGLREALDDALQKASGYASGLKGQKIYLKADIVNYIDKMSKESVKAEIDSRLNGAYRYGVSFGESFQTSFTEEEMNGYRLFDKTDPDGFMYKRMNALLLSQGKEMLSFIPGELIVFACRGYFSDGDSAYALYSNPMSSLYGMRMEFEADPGLVEGEIATNIQFLTGMSQPDGSFTYGRWPATNNDVEGYNILRHMGAVWALIERYRDTREESLAEPIAKALSYFSASAVAEKAPGVAYVYDTEPLEIKLGGAGLAVCAIVSYMEAFKTDEWLPLARSLGEGILSMQDPKTGAFRHVLHYKEKGFADFSDKEETRTVYYDGEATLALLSLYRYTGEERWLAAAKAALGRFILEDYTEYRDQWLAYCLAEITKYSDTVAYYNFALRNIQANLQTIRDASPGSHIVLEFLMSSFEVYERMLDRGIEPTYPQGFDEAAFIDTILYRASFMQSSCFFPEFAIHMSRPNEVMGLFFVRNDEFRVRIDDIQHFVSGYRLFRKSYSSLQRFQGAN
jgi:hypothetical protein